MTTTKTNIALAELAEKGADADLLKQMIRKRLVNRLLMGNYSAIRGPNSNSFAKRLVEKCGGVIRGAPPPTGWESADQVGF